MAESGQTVLGENALDELKDVFARQKAAFARSGPPTLEQRLGALDRCINILRSSQQSLIDALSQDFGYRSEDVSRLVDIGAALAPLVYAKKQLHKWIKPEKRTPNFPLQWFGARAEVQFVPKGVVGMIVPWNTPVFLTFAPLAGALAAGNRVMIKVSEHVPNTARVLASLLRECFTTDEVFLVYGESHLSQTFAQLPFDHLLFTGTPANGREVMSAAARNLTPITLELGGKCPVVLGRTADIAQAAQRIMMGKTLNVGQTCLAPDDVYVPSEKQDEFIEACIKSTRAMFPTIADNHDYGSMVSDAAYLRVRSLIDEARAAAVRVIEVHPGAEADETVAFEDSKTRRIAPTLVINPLPNLRVLQEEIFGPVLSIHSYAEIDDALKAINRRPEPLGLYYFGVNKDEQRYVLANTRSGGVTINDVIFHVSQEDLPFGGIGASGIGAYHGRDGFLEFSHKRAIYTQVRQDLTAIMRPPYSERVRAFIRSQIGRNK